LAFVGFSVSSKYLQTFAQSVLTRIGEYLGAQQIRKLNGALNYLEVGRWLKAHGFTPARRFPTRPQLYSAIANSVANERVLYLEFGVYTGTSLRHWCRLLRNPLSSLHGFDSFEGLPEGWDEARPKGEFARPTGPADGKRCLPRVDDPRVRLHIGWFQQTLPAFELPEHERLILNLDADLYSSTRFVLDTLQAALKPGTIICFDEFSDRLNELKAFNEFLNETGIPFRCLGGTTNLERVAFERVD
jgi:Macrocin-O-methyltransferase (TylF)